MSSEPVPTIFFGAFDRHNFGDLLFPHIAAEMLAPAYPVFAGLVATDLRGCGGHKVEAMADLAARWRDAPVSIVHVGGEILTCDAFEAAVMTLPPEEARAAIANFDVQSRQAWNWARRRTGLAGHAPYLVQRAMFPRARTVIYNGVGGVELDRREEAFREEVFGKLRAADAVGVRDHLTQAHLRAAGIDSVLMPDPAVMVAELFGDAIHVRAEEGEVARMRKAFPGGYLAVQFSAEFGDEATLSAIAGQMNEIVRAAGIGIVFFRSGAAPWHDDIACLERCAALMPDPAVKVFTSLDAWDICALISASRGYIGSSLHGSIVDPRFETVLRR